MRDTAVVKLAFVQTRLSIWKRIVTALLLAMACTAHGSEFTGNVLRGMDRLHVEIKGVSGKFERFGLNAQRLRKQTEQRMESR